MRAQYRLFPRGTIVALVFLTVCVSIARADEIIELKPGFAMLLRLQKSFNTVSVGNPEVADVVPFQTERAILLTGKAAGATNLIVLDEARNEIFNATVLVGARDTGKVSSHSRNNLHDYWAYRCTPICERVEDKFERIERPAPVIVVPQSDATPTQKPRAIQQPGSPQDGRSVQ